jgi:hypothetical protein
LTHTCQQQSISLANLPSHLLSEPPLSFTPSTPKHCAHVLHRSPINFAITCTTSSPVFPREADTIHTKHILYRVHVTLSPALSCMLYDLCRTFCPLQMNANETTKLRNLPERAESGVGFRDLAGRRSVEEDDGGKVCLREQC